MIQFKCPHCEKAFRVEDSYAGKHAKCSCGERITIPGASAPAPPVSAQHEQDEAEALAMSVLSPAVPATAHRQVKPASDFTVPKHAQVRENPTPSAKGKTVFRRWFPVLVGLLLTFIIGIGALEIADRNGAFLTPALRKMRDELEARKAAEPAVKVAAEHFVKQSLKYPDDAEFLSDDQSVLLSEPPGKKPYWTIRGKVKTVNGFGGKHTETYLVALYCRNGEEEWKARSIMIGHELLLIPGKGDDDAPVGSSK